MDNENEIIKEENIKTSSKKYNFPPIVNIIFVVILIISGWIYTIKLKNQEILFHPARYNSQNEISSQGVMDLPVKWGDLGVQMTNTGVVDKTKFESIYIQRGGLTEADKKLLPDSNNGDLVITPENSGVVLNLLWALGLGNKNPILDDGPMMDPKYGGAGNFASTGGWTLAEGKAMTHYSKHSFITLTSEQQALVERVSKNIYRPCCDNSTYFPDCNHGMAMLGLLELMASQGVSEADMYKFALKVNNLWFPGQYEIIKTFVTSQGVDWDTVDPKKVLGIDYSSASGYKKILSQVKPPEQKGGTSCGA